MKEKNILFLDELRQLKFLEEFNFPKIDFIGFYQLDRFKLAGTKYFLEYSSRHDSLVWKKSALCLLDDEDLIEECLLGRLSVSQGVSLADVLDNSPEYIQEKIIFHLDMLSGRKGEEPETLIVTGDIKINMAQLGGSTVRSQTHMMRELGMLEEDIKKTKETIKIEFQEKA